MPVMITIPRISEAITDARIDEWFKEDGDWVELGEPMLGVCTGLAEIVVPCPCAGVLRIKVQSGATVPVGTVVAQLEQEDEVSAVDSGERGVSTAKNSAFFRKGYWVSQEGIMRVFRSRETPTDNPLQRVLNRLWLDAAEFLFSEPRVRSWYFIVDSYGRFRLSPDDPWGWATEDGDQAILITPDRPGQIEASLLEYSNRMVESVALTPDNYAGNLNQLISLLFSRRTMRPV